MTRRLTWLEDTRPLTPTRIHEGRGWLHGPDPQDDPPIVTCRTCGEDVFAGERCEACRERAGNGIHEERRAA